MPLSLREKLKQASRANLANNAAKTMHKLAVMERPDAGSTAVAVETNKPTHSPTQSPTDQPTHQPSRPPSNLPNYREAHPEANPPTQAPTVPPTIREAHPLDLPLTYPKDYPVANPDLNDDVWTMLTPAQRQVLAYLAGHGGEITRYAAISAETGLSVGTIQTIFKRLKKLGLMTSQYSSRGTIKGMRFSLDRRVFERTDPVDYPKAYPVDYPLTSLPSRLPTQSPTQSPTQTSGNVLIDREKNLSISLAVLQTTWPTLAKTGFGLEQLRQIVENLTALAKPTDRILQGLDHIEFELTHGELVDKEGQPVADPCSWTFRSLAQNGYYRRPKGYVSSEEQALLDQEAEAQAVLLARKKAEQARFEAWQAGLSPEELEEFLRDHPGGPKEAWLKHVWKENGGA